MPSNSVLLSNYSALEKLPIVRELKEKNKLLKKQNDYLTLLILEMSIANLPRIKDTNLFEKIKRATKVANQPKKEKKVVIKTEPVPVVKSAVANKDIIEIYNVEKKPNIVYEIKEPAEGLLCTMPASPTERLCTRPASPTERLCNECSQPMNKDGGGCDCDNNSENAVTDEQIESCDTCGNDATAGLIDNKFWCNDCREQGEAEEQGEVEEEFEDAEEEEQCEAEEEVEEQGEDEQEEEQEEEVEEEQEEQEEQEEEVEEEVVEEEEQEEEVVEEEEQGEAEQEVEEEQEEEEVVEEEEEVVEEEEEQGEAEQEEVVEEVEEVEEEVEVEEQEEAEEEEEEVQEVTIKGKTYYALNLVDGIIYDTDENGDICVEVGKYVNGKPVMNKPAKK